MAALHPGLAQRLWCGAASAGSARWAGEQGLNLLTSSVVETEDGDERDLTQTQAGQVAAFRAAHPDGAGASRHVGEVRPSGPLAG